MIWYLLYPFRGTTEPPQLKPNHPLHKSFVQYGTATARHWLLSILFSVTIAVLLCYPAFFLYDSPTAGLYNLPRHAWTSVTPYQGKPDTRADVEMRQIWVHGSYMKALELDVFREALRIQDAIIGPGFGPSSRHARRMGTEEFDSDEALSWNLCTEHIHRNIYWGFHSPLMYWNCSMESLEADPDVLATINALSTTHSFLNFTLRPTSVFAGKSFSRDKLVAADALVITLLDRMGLHIAEEWDNRCQRLAAQSGGRWSFYPENGSATRSQLYEFRFEPMSLHDDVGLAFAYGFMALYVITSLRKIRAVKSKVGLIITIVAQIAITFLASFTICDMIPAINLTQIPREMYPFVALVLGLENMFRLVNAVLACPPEMPTAQRIGKALGQVGHLSLAAAAQNMALLGLLSRVVSPGVAAFCTFAAVAIVLDFVFHLTLFTAVLSVDVRRVELQESLDRINHAKGHAKSGKPDQRSNKIWAAFWSKLPFSTRIAGTAVMICFVLVLNSHLYDGDGQTRFLFRMLRFRRPAGAPHASSDSFLSPPIHQARTPAAWLKMQDHDTAKELIQFVKPHSHSFVARVYEPLTLVLKGSDRGNFDDPYISFFNTLRELAGKHFFPFALVIVFSIAIVTLLMNYLLGLDFPDDDEDHTDHHEESLSIRTLSGAHFLDVVSISGTAKGHLVTVSIDRSTAIWLLDLTRKTFSTITLRTADVNPPVWPIISATLDDEANALALCTDAGTVTFWDVNEGRFKYFTSVDLHGHAPSLFAFTTFRVGGRDMLSLIVVTPDGLLYQLGFHSTKIRTHWIHHDHILSASICGGGKEQAYIIAAFSGGQVRTVMLSEESLPQSQETMSVSPLQFASLSRVRFVLPVPVLGLVALVRSGQVDLVDIHNRMLIHSLQIAPAKAASLRILHSPRRLCQCKTFGVRTLSVVYNSPDLQDCIMQTYCPEVATAVICLRPPQERAASCIGIESVSETDRCLGQPGAWEATGQQLIIGVRKRASDPTQPPVSGSEASSYATSSDQRAHSHDPENAFKHLEYRTPKHPSPIRTRSDAVTSHRTPDPSDSFDFDNWEAWTLSSSGELYTLPLFKSPLANCGSYFQNGRALEVSAHDEGDQPPLFVTKPGPIARLGKRTIAVALGNIVKVVTYAEARMFEDDLEEFHDPSHASMNRRRRVSAKKAQ